MKLKNKRIFIVEDDLRNKAIAQMLLERAGATVSFDRWGLDTIAKLHHFAPADVILLDLMFRRGVTGYDIFQQIRGHQEFADIPIIAVSASDPSEAIPRTQELGFSGFIAKPVDFHGFCGQVAQSIAGEPVWQALGRI
ncbi:MAG: response regulator [Anaerolineae bacterium]|nr:response regulator [Anaerolineae bacterium]MDQ7037314.1 response regulator [Anaerolineae bacterium]